MAGTRVDPLLDIVGQDCGSRIALDSAAAVCNYGVSDAVAVRGLQMVEQFEGRVEAGMDEVRAQLASALLDIRGCQERVEVVAAAAMPPLEVEELHSLRERTDGLERRLETVQAGASGTGASAAV